MIDKKLKSIIVIFLVVSAIGFSDALYLTIQHLSGLIPPCTSVSGCVDVLTSKYSEFMGMPVALFGSLYYFVVFVGALLFLVYKKETLLRLTSYMTACGLIASAYFVYIQLFVLKQICFYCMGSALSSTILFIIALIVLHRIGFWSSRLVRTGI